MAGAFTHDRLLDLLEKPVAKKQSRAGEVPKGPSEAAEARLAGQALATLVLPTAASLDGTGGST